MGPPLDPITSLRTALRGHYEIEREIGQGAYATVYLARDLKHERKVAIKVLHADPTSETGELRFIREIRLLARLQHPNILPLHDSGHVEALLYYVMPYVSGETLRDRINREKQLALQSTCNIARDVADALAYAHGQGIIHRDIKPENILLSAGHPILADFGIARVIDLAGVRQVTRTGMGSPGTPAYMSPEQLMGDKELDGRSDTYSLGCVLFEMLTGRPPFSGKEGFVKRFTEAPPSPSTVRKDLPSWMDDVVATALARAPNDRYQTAHEFLSALSPGVSAPNEVYFRNQPRPRVAGETDSSDSARTADGLATLHSVVGKASALATARSDAAGTTTSWLLQRLSSRPRASVALGVVLLLGAIAFAAAIKPSRVQRIFAGGVTLDTARFAILPFAPISGIDSTDTGDRVADRLYDALSQWEGLPLVPATRVAQELGEASPPRTESEALSLARRIGAGKLIWGQASGRLGAIRVRAHLYDVASGQSRDGFLFVDSAGDARVYAPAALRLLGARARPPAAAGGDGLTQSYPAWSAYGRGHIALNRSDLPAAEREFRAAIKADGAYAPPRLWLAQVLAWRTSYARGEWEEQALRATSERARLSERDRTLLGALAAMSGRQYPAACQSFAQLTKADSLDFAGWLGLGDCQYLDSLVVPLAASPSAWSFRSSYHGAALDYMRAINLYPGAHSIVPFARIESLLPTAPTQVRTGRGAPPGREWFAAYPGLIGDSLLFIPYSLAVFQNLPTRTTNAKQLAALTRDASILREFATRWTREEPKNPQAHEALANVLETSGELFADRPGKASAISSLRVARQFSPPGTQVRIAAREVWVNLKGSRFVEARTLADSILDAKLGSDNMDPRAMLGLAAITGRLAKASDFASASRDWVPASSADLPYAINEAAARLFVHAAFGVCGEQLNESERALDSKLDSFISDEEKSRVRAEIKARPLSMMAPCTNAQSALRILNPTSRISRLQQAYARNEKRRLATMLDSAIAETRLRRPGDLSLDYTYQLAWLRAAAGDSSGAMKQLDQALDALPSVSTMSLREGATAASAVRAMILCADLASRAGDTRTARKWSRAVVILWGGADPALQPIVRRMRALAVEDQTE
jgi:serine/threonine protein kinase/tetratricopeptide (TPR) repeat protein